MSEILVVKLGGTTIQDQAQVLEEVGEVGRTEPPQRLVRGGEAHRAGWRGCAAGRRAP